LAVLITGGSGLVGSHTVMELLHRGQEDVIIIYDIVPPRNPAIIKELGKKVIYVDGNILDFGRLMETASRYDVDGIIHTSAFINYKYVVSNPMISIQTNVMGTLNVLELARVTDLKVAFTSSGAVYGEVVGHATEEFPIKPSDMYGMTKAAAELIGQQYASTYGIDFVCVRFYFIYGSGLSVATQSIEEALKPPVHPLSILYLLLLRAATRESLYIENGGDSELDFTYVKDSAHGLVLAYYAKKPPHTTYNISTGQAHSLKEVVDIISSHTGRRNIMLGPGMIEGWPRRAKYLDNTLAREELGYSPRYGLRNGIIEYYEAIKAGLR